MKKTFMWGVQTMVGKESRMVFTDNDKNKCHIENHDHHQNQGKVIRILVVK